MERWVRFALADLRRNWKKTVVSATGFILGIALMVTLLILASGAAAIGLTGLDQTDQARGSEIILHALAYSSLFEQVFDTEEIQEIRGMMGVEEVWRYTDLWPVWLVRNTSPTPTGHLDLELVLTDSYRGMVISSGRAPAHSGEIILTQRLDRLPANLRGTRIGEVIEFSTTSPTGGTGGRYATRIMDGRGYVVTGFFTDPGSEAFKDTAAFAKTDPQIPINGLVIRFRDQGHAREAYHQLSERYRELPIRVDSSLVMDEKSAQKRREWSWFLVLISASATCIGSVAIVNSFLLLSLSRRREIGVMRSVGASRNQMLGLFFFEHLVLILLFFLAGFVTGLVLGGSINTFVFRRYIPEIRYAYGLKAMLPLTWDVLAYPGLVTLAMGLVASMVPSIKASRMEPAEATRYDE